LISLLKKSCTDSLHKHKNSSKNPRERGKSQRKVDRAPSGNKVPTFWSRGFFLYICTIDTFGKQKKRTMKKLILLLFVHFLSYLQTVDAQDYHPLIEPNKTWDDVFCMQCSVCPDVVSRHFTTGNDSLINGLLFTKIGRYPVISGFTKEICPPYYVDTIPSEFFSLVYEDILNRKVYFLQYGSQTPELLYDFTLQAGDTFSGFITQGEGAIVEYIDEVILLNGESRRRWNFLCNGGQYWCTEGIGLETGLFGDMFQFEWYGELECVQKNGEPIWESESSWGGCWGFVGENELNTSQIEIYPNPADDFVFISLPGNSFNAVIRFYDLTGQLLFQKEIRSSNDFLDVSRVSPGLYFLNLQYGDFIHKQKVVIR
jgi:hypothetical protein